LLPFCSIQASRLHRELYLHMTRCSCHGPHLLFTGKARQSHIEPKTFCIHTHTHKYTCIHTYVTTDVMYISRAACPRHPPESSLSPYRDASSSSRNFRNRDCILGGLLCFSTGGCQPPLHLMTADIHRSVYLPGPP
jgi:hypothetical protein